MNSKMFQAKKEADAEFPKTANCLRSVTMLSLEAQEAQDSL